MSRDRGGIYAQAAREAAPGAVQVADRWHLLNLSEALKNALSPHQRLLTQAARNSTGEATTVASSVLPPCYARKEPLERITKCTEEPLQMSVRQAQQLLARYQDGGGAALIHRSRGRTASNRLSHGVREYVLELVRQNHRDFGPTLAAEVLREPRPSSACFHFFTV